MRITKIIQPENQEIKLDDITVVTVMTTLAKNYTILDQVIYQIVENFFQNRYLFENIDPNKIIKDGYFENISQFLEECEEKIIDGFYYNLKNKYKILTRETFFKKIKDNLIFKIDADIQKKILLITNLKNMTDFERNYHYTSLVFLLLAKESLNQQKIDSTKVLDNTSSQIMEAVNQ